MTINKFQGKTKEEAIEKAKAEFGPNAVIMNIKEIKPKGIMGMFASSTFEVTAAMEEKETFSSSMSAVSTYQKGRENISLSADEEIAIPKPMRTPAREEVNVSGEDIQSALSEINAVVARGEQKKKDTVETIRRDDQYRERLDNLSDKLDQQFTSSSNVMRKNDVSAEGMNFIRMIYNTLLKNEVNEKYVNQILDEVEKYIRPGNNVDLILPNIYQKLILTFGQPKTIELSGKNH